MLVGRRVTADVGNAGAWTDGAHAGLVWVLQLWPTSIAAGLASTTTARRAAPLVTPHQSGYCFVTRMWLEHVLRAEGCSTVGVPCPCDSKFPDSAGLAARGCCLADSRQCAPPLSRLRWACSMPAQRPGEGRVHG
jgi:hypothetical protein